MALLVSGESELEVDLESGGTTSEEEKTRDLPSGNSKKKKDLTRVWSGLLDFDQSVKKQYGISSSSSTSKLGEVEPDSLLLSIDKNSEGEESCQNIVSLEKKCAQGKHKKARKHPKPPRPPKGPSLNATDKKLVREIAELALRKRARMDRIKALKKMKAAKMSSSNGTLSAMIITLIFCFIIIFQGMLSRSTATVMLDGSPAPAAASNEGLISVQLLKNFSPSERDEPGSSRLEKQVSSSGLKEDANQVSRRDYHNHGRL